jgi:hypothetical protein
MRKWIGNYQVQGYQNIAVLVLTQIQKIGFTYMAKGQTKKQIIRDGIYIGNRRIMLCDLKLLTRSIIQSLSQMPVVSRAFFYLLKVSAWSILTI